MKKSLFLLSFLLVFSACSQPSGPVQRAKHVVLIGIDGWAAEAVRLAPAEDLPNIRSLMEGGSWTLSKRSVMPSASAINWGSMLNGLPTEMHGLSKWNSTHGTIPSTSDNGHGIPPTIFTLIREQHPRANTGCLYDWDVIGAIADSLAMDYHYWIKTYTSTDETLVSVEDYTRLATDYIRQNRPEFFFLYYGSLDEAGHTHGWYGETYMERQRIIDAGIGQVIGALKEAGIYDDTVILLAADHGGTGKGHGEFSLLELETPFIVSGKGIRKGYEITVPVMQYDTPAVIADILGIRIPDDWRGRAFPQIYN